MSLSVTLCVCDHILGLEGKYFCGTNGCSPTPRGITIELNQHFYDAVVTKIKHFRLQEGTHLCRDHEWVRLYHIVQMCFSFLASFMAHPGHCIFTFSVQYSLARCVSVVWIQSKKLFGLYYPFYVSVTYKVCFQLGQIFLSLSKKKTFTLCK